MNQPPYYTRKELAALIHVSVDQVRKNERRWGIDIARRNVTPRCVRYRTLVVFPILKELGLIE